MNRKEHKIKLNEVNTKYWETKNLLEKMPNAAANIEKLNKAHKTLLMALVEMSEDDLMKLNNGKSIKIA